MKRRTRNKVIKQFCAAYALKMEWFIDCQGKTIGQLKASLHRRLDDLMETYYRRGY